MTTTDPRIPPTPGAAGRDDRRDPVDVAVVGGGIAGLTAAAFAARTGASVMLVEARRQGGGRARSRTSGGFTFNQGAHALYRAGALTEVLGQLGVRWRGHGPSMRRSAWMIEGESVPWSTGLGPLGGVAGLRALAGAIRPSARARYRGASMSDWLDDQPEAARPMLSMAVRTATYASDLASFEAEAALTQLARAARGVRYLDGGWQTVVDGLSGAVNSSGVVTVRGKVTSIESARDGWEVVVGERPVRASAVVLANGGPGDADRLLGGASPTLTRWADAAVAQTAFCLDVALEGAPGTGPALYGLDEPLYLVDHARSARLAPPGGALVHGLFYEPDRAGEDEPEERLEAALDVWLPSWRDRVVDVVARRQMVVAHDRPAPGTDVAHRPTSRLCDLEGIWLAGDAVTAEGLLADAAASSGRTAGGEAGRHTRAIRPARPEVFPGARSAMPAGEGATLSP